MKLLLDTHTFIMHHKDPFDRLLIAQTNVEKVVLVSRDKIFKQYSVKLLW